MHVTQIRGNLYRADHPRWLYIAVACLGIHQIQSFMVQPCRAPVSTVDPRCIRLARSGKSIFSQTGPGDALAFTRISSIHGGAGWTSCTHRARSGGAARDGDGTTQLGRRCPAHGPWVGPSARKVVPEALNSAAEILRVELENLEVPGAEAIYTEVSVAEGC